MEQRRFRPTREGEELRICCTTSPATVPRQDGSPHHVLVDSSNRWLTHPARVRPSPRPSADESIKIAFGAGDRADGLKTLYHRQLQKAAKFVRYFEMRDGDNRVVYYLFFASNNALPPERERGHVESRSNGRPTRTKRSSSSSKTPSSWLICESCCDPTPVSGGPFLIPLLCLVGVQSVGACEKNPFPM